MKTKKIAFGVILLLVISISSCKKEEESSLQLLYNGLIQTNTTYQMNGFTNFDVVLIRPTGNVTISIVTGTQTLSTTVTNIGTNTKNITVKEPYIRFSSSDYYKEEKYEEIISISNLK